MPKREYDFPSLLPDELFGIAERLSPSVQVVELPCRYPGGEVRPAWWGFALVDGEVVGTATTDCPLESYSSGSLVLKQHLKSREPSKVGSDHIGEANKMVGGLFG